MSVLFWGIDIYKDIISIISDVLIFTRVLSVASWTKSLKFLSIKSKYRLQKVIVTW